MAKQKRKPSRGPVRVGLLALHDRKFFARLLKDPRMAMKAKKGKLRLTRADMAQVVELIRKQRAAHPKDDPMVMFDRYRKLGLFDKGDWPRLWKER